LDSVSHTLTLSSASCEAERT